MLVTVALIAAKVMHLRRSMNAQGQSHSVGGRIVPRIREVLNLGGDTPHHLNEHRLGSGTRKYCGISRGVSPDELRQIMVEGFDAVITKPITCADVSAQLDAAVRHTP